MTFTAEPKADRVDLWTEVSVAGVRYLRLPLHTEWLDESDDLVLALKESLKVARPGDTVGISETVTILLTGRTVDIGVSIVDLNDFGGSIRAVSPRSLSAETLAAVLSDNPLGQRLTSTPFVLVRPA